MFSNKFYIVAAILWSFVVIGFALVHLRVLPVSKGNDAIVFCAGMFFTLVVLSAFLVEVFLPQERSNESLVKWTCWLFILASLVIVVMMPWLFIRVVYFLDGMMVLQ